MDENYETPRCRKLYRKNIPVYFTVATKKDVREKIDGGVITVWKGLTKYDNLIMS